LRFSDFGAALDELWKMTEVSEPPVRLPVLLVPDRCENAGFDRVKQEFSMSLYDKKGRSIILSAPYDAHVKLLIENLMKTWEQIEKTKVFGVFLAELYLGKDGLQAFPITHYGDQAVNLGLDAYGKGSKEPKFQFDWM
jgi:hypothetical protein